MTIYMVIANNREAYEDYAEWNEAAFSSRKSAEDYIKNQIEEHSRDIHRMYEIEAIEYDRKLTDDENAEYQELNYKWPYDSIYYKIRAFDVLE